MKSKTEKAVILGVFSHRTPEIEIIDSLRETELLLNTSGGIVKKKFFQKRHTPDKKFLLGKGKVREIENYVQIKKILLAVSINPLTNIQQINLEKKLQIKVIDRTRLILDVFSLHARTKKGKLQVELAQLLYNLPRLKGKGVELSRLGAGIGTRGPGETKLETDRRKIKKRIVTIKNSLKKINRDRREKVLKKKQSWTPLISLSGYTSSGKTTLFNKLTSESEYVNKKPFSTLVPVLRRLDLSNFEIGHFCFLTDTVGFIRNMPQQLIESFYSTLEEIRESDLILNIVDISDRRYSDKDIHVQRVLSDLGITNEKIINVYNKIDLKEEYIEEQISLPYEERNSVYISAKTGTGIIELKKVIFQKLFSNFIKYKILMKKEEYFPSNLRKWAIITREHKTGEIADLEIFTTEEKMLKFISGNPEVFYEIPT